MSEIENLLDPKGPVAIVITERLRPVAGHGSVVFPPTYAPDKDQGQRSSRYNIDVTRTGKRCTIDSVQSQANRTEPVFMSEPYSSLVPQIVIKAGSKEVNLLEAAHRLADAAARFSGLENEVEDAFNEFCKSGNATKIAQLNPMSILFGAWDSRGTQAKLPRIFSSYIFAEDVEDLTRFSQFNPSFTVDDLNKDNLSDEDLSEQERAKWSTVGLAHAPGSALGGIIAHGGIKRQATMNLVALRHLKGEDESKSKALRKYILGLGLVCATLDQDYDLRSGCHLVRDGKDARTFILVTRDGEEKSFQFDLASAVAMAKEAAKELGIRSKRREVEFDSEKATTSLGEAKAKKGAKSRKGRT